MQTPTRRALGSLFIDPRPWSTDLGLLLLRLSFGLAMLCLHGWAKLPVDDSFIAMIADLGLPLPAAFAWAAVLAEFLGGALILVGLLTRPAALAVLGTMLVAIVFRYSGRPIDERELAILYATACVALLFTGPGRYSLDHIIGRRRT